MSDFLSIILDPVSRFFDQFRGPANGDARIAWPASVIRLTLLFIPLWGMLTVGWHTVDFPEARGFIEKETIINSEQRYYLLYVPDNYDPNQQWPLIVFLSGLLQYGDNNLIQAVVGIAPAILRAPENYPCLVLLLQTPTFDFTSWEEGHVEVPLQETLAAYNIDEDRIYLTGLSSGGISVYEYGANHVETFAALLPTSGCADPEDAERLAQIPIWAFHSTLDRIVPIEDEREGVEAIQAAGGYIRLSEFPVRFFLGHWVWPKAYDDPEVIAWLLAQRRGQPPVEFPPMR